MTNKENFLNYIQERKARYEWSEEKAGLMVHDTQLNTKTLIADEAFNKYTIAALIQITHQGRNVEHITRVTGYMSKVSGWNAGKKSELKDRSRTSEDLNKMEPSEREALKAIKGIHPTGTATGQ